MARAQAAGSGASSEASTADARAAPAGPRAVPAGTGAAPASPPAPGLTPDRVVLALGLLGGLLLVFVTPPFQVPDEPSHFFHIYQIAVGASPVPGPGGGLGFQLPASLPALVDLCVAGVPFHQQKRLPDGLLSVAWRLPLAPERLTFLPAGGLNPYTPVPYLAAAPAVALGRLLSLPPLALLYLARLANLAASLALVWAAVRLAPIHRWVFTLLALTPMAMFERSSASADALTDALALLLMSCILALAVGRPGAPRSGRLAALLLAAAALVAAAKAVYFLLDLLIFLVPSARLGTARRAAAFRLGGLVAIAAGAGVSWWVAHRFFTFGLLRSGVQPFDQLRGALAAPLHFVAIAAADYAQHAARYASELVGNFGWLDSRLPIVALASWAMLLAAAALTDGDPAVALAGWQRGMTAAVVAATLLALSFAQYVAWTRLGAPFVEGLQGRYFLPLAPAGALLLYNRRLAGRWPAGPHAGWRFGGISLAFILLTLMRIWFRYHLE